MLDRLAEKFQGLLSLTSSLASILSASSDSLSETCTCLPGFSLAMAVCTASVLKLGAVSTRNSGRLARMLASLNCSCPCTVILPITKRTIFRLTMAPTSCGGRITRYSAKPCALSSASSAAVACCKVSSVRFGPMKGASTRSLSALPSGCSPLNANPLMGNTVAAAPAVGTGDCASARPGHRAANNTARAHDDL